MRFRFLFLLISSSLLLSGQRLQEMTTSLANSDAVKDGRFSFYAVNLSTGEPIVSHDIDRKVSPASTMKLITTYAALDILGPEYRFVTKVGYTGGVDADGVLHGDLIIEADGDPALDSKHFMKKYGNGAPFQRQILKALREEGVKIIDGKIIIDQQCYTGIDIPDEWSWQDMGNYYGAGAHAFSFQENEYVITLKSGGTAGDPTELLKTDLLMQEHTLFNEVKSAAISSDQAYCYSSPESRITKMFGEIPLNKNSFDVKASMSDPAAEFIARLKRSLSESGIDYEGNELDVSLRNPDGSYDVQEILEMESPRLMELTAYTNMRSDNLYAEHLLRQIGRKQKGEGSYQKGAEAVIEWCASKGINTRGLTVKDGCGLSRADQVSARFMLSLLTSLSNETYFDSFMTALPKAGQSGSMKRIGTGTAIAGRMYAKTGYIEGVRAYAGYLDKGETKIAFCIIANDYDVSASAMRKKLSKLMVGLGG